MSQKEGGSRRTSEKTPELIGRLPEVLKRLRARARLTQRQVAARCHANGTRITQAMVSQYERGVQFPNLVSLLALLEIFGASWLDLDVTLAELRAEEAAAGAGKRASATDDILAAIRELIGSTSHPGGTELAQSLLRIQALFASAAAEQQRFLEQLGVFLRNIDR